MKISGFTFLRNASRLHYPFVESIRSVLPLVDEFVIALGDSDADDTTREQIEAIGSDKIRWIDTIWDLDRFPHGSEYAHQTDIAKEQATGDWLLYIQGDEVIHEDDLPLVQAACERWLDERGVDALLFDYLHFWGDYTHVLDSHRWYKQEMRVIRNDPAIHSMRDAQSFRRIRDFDGRSYMEKAGTEKLVAVHSGARIFHYGWVRPPRRMKTKVTEFVQHHQAGTGGAGESQVQQPEPTPEPPRFDYGPLGRIPRYGGTHPAVMKERIAAMDWGDDLNQTRRSKNGQAEHPHERFKYRAITWMERTFFGGRHLFASRNYVMWGGLPNPRKRNPPTPRP